MVTKLILEPAIGDSLFVAEGADWLWQRRAAAPVFSHRNVAALAPVMTAAADRAAARIKAATGRAADMFAEMVAATFEVICDVTFSDGGSFDRDTVQRATEAYVTQTAKVSFLDIIGAPAWVPRPSRMVTPAPMRAMKAMADAAIEARRKAGAKPVPDLLDLLLEGSDPATGRRMTTAELRDNLLTFIIAGHETTALTLAWALYLCAFDDDVQAAARAEAQAVLGAAPPLWPIWLHCRRCGGSWMKRCGFIRLPRFCRAPHWHPTPCAGATFGPAIPSFCRSTRFTGTTGFGPTPTGSTLPGSTAQGLLTVSPICRSATVRASASVPVLRCKKR